VQYAMDAESLSVLVMALLIGTPILSLLGAIGAALTLGLRAGSSLLALLILPLYVPVLIFGAGAVDAVRAGLGAGANLSLLAAGRGVPDHFHSRAVGLDVDVPVYRDGVLGRAGARLQHAPVGDDGAGDCAHRRAHDVHRALDRCAVGAPHVGHLLGMGRADDL